MYFTFDRHENSASPANTAAAVIEDWRPRERLSMYYSFWDCADERNCLRCIMYVSQHWC